MDKNHKQHQRTTFALILQEQKVREARSNSSQHVKVEAAKILVGSVHPQQVCHINLNPLNLPKR